MQKVHDLVLFLRGLRVFFAVRVGLVLCVVLNGCYIIKTDGCLCSIISRSTTFHVFKLSVDILFVHRMGESVARAAPCGLQDILNRLAVVALSNKPVCFYDCFAEALERDVIRRTLLEIQAEQCKLK